MLSEGEKILKIFLFVSTEFTNVTDTETDGRTDGHHTTLRFHVITNVTAAANAEA